MNIYLHELKANRKFIFTWLVSMLALACMMLAMYGSISQDIDVFKQILSNFPASLRMAFGISIDRIGSILGYYSSFVLSIILVCSSMEAMILGMSILSKEVREKTADFLYTKPVSRTKIITSKILASFTLLLISNIVYILALYATVVSVSSIAIDLNVFMLLALIPLFIQCIFFSLGIALSSLMNKVKAVLPLSMGITFGFYILSAFSDEKMRAFMPFKYFDTNYIFTNSKYEFKYVILTFVIVLISTALTYVIYKKKDIHSV